MKKTLWATGLLGLAVVHMCNSNLHAYTRRVRYRVGSYPIAAHFDRYGKKYARSNRIGSVRVVERQPRREYRYAYGSHIPRKSYRAYGRRYNPYYNYWRRPRWRHSYVGGYPYGYWPSFGTGFGFGGSRGGYSFGFGW